MRGWRPRAAAVALLPALILTAAQAPAGPALIVHATLDLGNSQELIAFSGKELIVRDGRSVTVYEPDGRRRWNTTLTNVEDAFFRIDLERGQVLAMAQRRQVPRTFAFDLATGQRLWEFEGWAEAVDEVIVLSSAQDETQTIIDARTLTERWRVSDTVSRFVDRDAHSLLAIDEAGRLVEYELSSGAVIRTRQLDLPRSRDYGMGAFGNGITIFYQTPSGAEPSMLMLDREHLTPLPPGTERPSQKRRFPCGPVVCESAFDDGQVITIDPRSGLELWRSRPGAGITPTPSGLFSYPLYEATNTSEPLALLEPRSGRRITTMQGWHAIPVVHPDMPFHQAAPVMLRQVHTTGALGKTFIAGFDASGPRILGSVPHIIFQCQFVEWVLACMTGDRKVIVVEINSGAWRW